MLAALVILMATAMQMKNKLEDAAKKQPNKDECLLDTDCDAVACTLSEADASAPLICCSNGTKATGTWFALATSPQFAQTGLVWGRCAAKTLTPSCAPVMCASFPFVCQIFSLTAGIHANGMLTVGAASVL